MYVRPPPPPRYVGGSGKPRSKSNAKSNHAQGASHPTDSSARNAPNRRFFDKVLKDAEFTFRDDHAAKFLVAVVEFQDDPLDLLYRLTNIQEQGLKRLKAALAYSCSASSLSSYVVPFLNILGSDCLCRGSCEEPLSELLKAMYEVPGFLRCLVKALEGNKVDNAGPLGWFALNVALHVKGARSYPELIAMIQPLDLQGGAASAATGQLRTLLATGTTACSSDSIQAQGQECPLVAIEDLQMQAWGRHDNDHVNFRDISIMVTREEVLSSRPSYLPRAHDPHSFLGLPPEAALLDRWFRLYREDMVGPLRQELKALGIVQTHSPGASDAQGLKLREGSVTTSHKSRNVYEHVTVIGVATKPRPCVLVSVALPPGHRALRQKTHKEREEFWRSYGHGTLPLDSLVCLVCPQQPLVFATVTRRDLKDLAAEKRPIVGLSFDCPGADEVWLLKQMGREELRQTVLVQVSAGFMSSRPVLQCLQGMSAVPFAEELVHGMEPKQISYLEKASIDQELTARQSSLDKSQLAALTQALSHRVALIQGPPGTGKTFTGVELCDIILRQSNKTLLVVCYTNHALDQFLEALLNKGITKDVVRIGGRSKSTTLEPYNLKQLSRNVQLGLGRVESRRMYQLRDQLGTTEETVGQLANVIGYYGMLACCKGGPFAGRKADDPQQGQGGVQGQRAQGGQGTPSFLKSSKKEDKDPRESQGSQKSVHEW